MKSLGRIPEFDERSRAFPVRELLGDTVTLQTKVWDLAAWLDQGSEGACVGFSLAHEIAAVPVVGDVDNDYARMIYREAQKIDAWPGEDYEGTSVLAGAKTVQGLGWITEYRWAFSVDDVLGAVSNLGPVVLGTNWYSGMWDTDGDGFIHVSGSVVGGHAILILGYDHERQAVLLHNSWGPGWGVNGRAWLSVGDLGRLLGEQGEVCVPLVRVDVDSEPDPEPEPQPQGCLPSALISILSFFKN